MILAPVLEQVTGNLFPNPLNLWARIKWVYNCLCKKNGILKMGARGKNVLMWLLKLGIKSFIWGVVAMEELDYRSDPCSWQRFAVVELYSQWIASNHVPSDRAETTSGPLVSLPRFGNFGIQVSEMYLYFFFMLTSVLLSFENHSLTE